MVRRFQISTALRYATDTSLYQVRLEVSWAVRPAACRGGA